MHDIGGHGGGNGRIHFTPVHFIRAILIQEQGIRPNRRYDAEEISYFAIIDPDLLPAGAREIPQWGHLLKWFGGYWSSFDDGNTKSQTSRSKSISSPLEDQEVPAEIDVSLPLKLIV
ncbi:hypothetical protein JTE90_023071 [Oedothorax gibbosus]|uniref:Uncharacterized protein n=1 Tax=Oedothorax gibbosus TaxID=931172 RepID=A0AAV6UYV7_9ARAC|nr:hypothetical protein JTE90_023071 [Oedothorax gibbosus]